MARYKKPQDDINLADSICDPNARKVTMFNCQNGSGATFGCWTVDGGNVPQVNQVTSPGTSIAGTNPIIPVYYLITHVDPQDPSLLGNGDFPTVPNIYSCGYNCPTVTGGGCVWAQGGVGQFTNWQDCDNAVNAGTCALDPTHFCQDYNVFEIIYPGTTYTGSTGMDETTVLGIILGRTTSSPSSTQQIPYPYSDPGGAWAGCGGSLSCMYNTLGTPAATIQGATSIYSPLKGSLDDCIDCCGGINQPFDSSGGANPFYNMGAGTHPGYAAYLAALGLPSSGPTYASFIPYLLSLGIDSCGQTVS